MGLELRGTSCSIWRTAFLVSALTVLAGTAARRMGCVPKGYLIFCLVASSGLVRRRPHRLLHLRSVE